MLVINESVLKKVARSQKDEEGGRRYKSYQVSNGNVLVGSEHTVVNVSNFSPLTDDYYEFDSNQVTTWDYDLASHYIDFVDSDRIIVIPSAILAHMAALITGWLKSKSELAKSQSLQLSFTPTGEYNTEMRLKANFDPNYPGMELVYTIPIRYEACRFVALAKEFQLFLLPFQKVKSSDLNPIDINLVFKSSSLNPQTQVCCEKFYLTTNYNGHTITSAYVVSPLRPSTETETTTQDVNDDLEIGDDADEA